MHKFIQKLSVEWVLRISLGLMYIFSGIDLIRYPTAWYWAVRPLPLFVQNIISRIGIDQYLKMQGIGELALALILIFKFIPRFLTIFVAGLTVVEMAAILILVGVDAITFRDIGVLGAALALYIILAGGSPEKVKEKKSLLLNENKTGQPTIKTYDEFMK